MTQIDIQADWTLELKEKYQASVAHAFLIDGNVKDYVAGVPGAYLRESLMSIFSKSWDIIVSWNCANGFRFPSQEMALPFAEIVGFPVPPAPEEVAQPARGRGLAAGLNAASSQEKPNLNLIKALEMTRDTTASLEFLNRLLAAESMRDPHTKEERPIRVAVICDYFETLAPASATVAGENDRRALVMFSEWGRNPQIGRKGHIVTMITNDIATVNEALRKSGTRWEQVEIPLPTLQDRASFLKTVMEDGGEESEIEITLAPNTTYAELARLANGLTYTNLEDIVYSANLAGVPLSREFVKARKQEIMKRESEEVLTVEEPERGFSSIGGHDEIKECLHESVIAPMRGGDYDACPQGVILLGPAGTGKTILAKALAAEAGYTFIALDPSKLGIKWVGESERRMRQALEAIYSMAPVIVFVDEIDQSYTRGEGGDNGTSSRMFKQLLEAMSNTAYRGRVLWVAASNHPELLDEAILRPGRFDIKLPVLAPDAQQRAAILAVLTSRVFGEQAELPTPEQYLALAEKMTEEYTGAELENIVGKALRIHRRGNRTIAQALEEAYDLILPSTGGIADMTELAISYCNDLEWVPSRYRARARELRHPSARAELIARMSARQAEEETPAPRKAKRSF